MSTLLQISINPSTFSTQFCRKPISWSSLSSPKIASFHQNRHKLRVYRDERWLGALRKDKDWILVKEEGLKRKKRVVLVRFNQGFGFNGGGGGGGGGGRDNSNTARVIGNLALAIGLTYLSMTGQLGWLLDAIVSIWLLAVIIPIVGLGAFLWWAGRDIVQGTCPNCGNDFQIFKSSLNDDELQLCPYCTQPFSVVDDEFVSETVRFSNQSTTFEQAFSDFFPGSKKGEESLSSKAIVDVEAEIKDAD